MTNLVGSPHLGNMAEKGSSRADNALPPCEICNAQIAIYRCPRCYTRTCSLECCRKHKAKDEISGELVCNGQRDRTKFCSLKRFTDAQLASDYHFLEDVMSSSTSSKRLYQSIVSGSSSRVSDNTKLKRVKANTVSTTRSGMVELANISASASEPVHPLLQAGKGRSTTVDILANRVSGCDFEEGELVEKQDNSQKSSVINRLLGNTQRTPNKNGAKKGKVDHLTRQAELGGVSLLRMPQGMGRRAANTSRFSKKNGLTWKIEFNFHYPSNGTSSINSGINVDDKSEGEGKPGFLMVESEVNEGSTWQEALGKLLDVHPGNSAIRSQLKIFANVQRDSLILLMKRLPCSSAAPQYIQFEANTTLKDSLRGKTIIEFPTVEVIFDTDGDRFPLFIGVL